MNTSTTPNTTQEDKRLKHNASNRAYYARIKLKIEALKTELKNIYLATKKL